MRYTSKRTGGSLSLYLIIAFLLVSCPGFAQRFLTGKVLKKDSKEFLVSVSIENRTQRRHDLSDERGTFRIQSAQGDMLIFSHVGYRTDTIVVDTSMQAGDYPVYMEPKAQTLRAVEVGSLSNYQLDSLARREEYSWVYDHGTPPRLERKRTGDGVGVSLNIFRNASKEDQDREKLKKRLMREEEEHYIDFRYSRDYVSRLTKLKGDSLQQFMMHFRPTYDYCRKAANVDILVYVNDSFKKYMKRGEL
ncbi:MAG: carboxypeptidase-like regulatory domain-containing protein [Chitinophagaceae bacterium]|nr:carboxypeptidase-like regulatory domain-containing protein [Chitinophagaceae bacterium]